MYSAAEQTTDFQSTDELCKELVSRIISKVEPRHNGLLIPANRPLDTSSSIYFLKEGSISYLRGGKILFYFEDGDLVGLEERDLSEDAQLLSPFAVIVDEYDRSDFVRQLGNDLELQALWNTYLSKQLNLYASMISSLYRNVVEIEPTIKHFWANESIFIEGSFQDEIFTLVKGRADVVVNGTKVGELEPDDVFGAYSVLSGTPRAASVVATEKCLALSLPRLDFLTMLRIKPLNFLKAFEVGSKSIVL